MYDDDPAPAPAPSKIETHFTVTEIATQWGFSAATVRKLFIDEPGVLHLTNPSRLMRKASQSKYVRRYGTFRIPESVFERVRDRMTLKQPTGRQASGRAVRHA